MRNFKELENLPELLRLPKEIEDIIIDYVKDLEYSEFIENKHLEVVNEINKLKINSNGIYEVIGYNYTPVRNLPRPIYRPLLHKTTSQYNNISSMYYISSKGQWVHSRYLLV